MESAKLVRDRLVKDKSEITKPKKEEQPKVWYYITSSRPEQSSYYTRWNSSLKDKFRSLAQGHFTKVAMADRTRIAPEADGLDIITL